MLDKLITYIVCWYKTLYQVFPVVTRNDAGSHNRVDLIQSLVPPHYVCNGYLYQVLPVVTHSDTGSHNRLDLIQSLVPPHYVFIMCKDQKKHLQIINDTLFRSI